MHIRGILENGIHGIIKNDDAAMFDDQRTNVDSIKSRDKNRLPNCI